MYQDKQMKKKNLDEEQDDINRQLEEIASYKQKSLAYKQSGNHKRASSSSNNQIAADAGGLGNSKVNAIHFLGSADIDLGREFEKKYTQK